MRSFVKLNPRQMAKLFCHLLMRVSHVIVTILYVANVSFNAIHENKILAKISEFTVTLFPPLSLPHLLVYSSSLYCKHYGPRPGCSLSSNLIKVHSVCFHRTCRGSFWSAICNRGRLTPVLKTIFSSMCHKALVIKPYKLY